MKLEKILEMKNQITYCSVLLITFFITQVCFTQPFSEVSCSEFEIVFDSKKEQVFTTNGLTFYGLDFSKFRF